jgi:multicomponent K+:H+ antiporter subunit D
MDHLAILPVLVPLVAGALLLAARGLGLRQQRLLSLAATCALLPIAVALLRVADADVLTVYRLGDWEAPFGIVLVVDRLAAILLLVTALVAIPALLYGLAGEDREGPGYHALFQFQLMGINGAFLTGDLFNLFVFFEILLIASYALLLHGNGAARTRAAVHVVVLNLVGSALFLVGVGAIYGVAGTLNLADLGRVMPLLTEADAGLARTGALLLLVVFALKAALLPLTFWLPQSYAVAPASVAALFAVLTKVGAYAILRVFTQVFGADAGFASTAALAWLQPAGLATFTFGVLAALAATGLGRIATSLVVASVGLLLATIGLGSEAGTAAAIYYLAHSALATAALFLVIDLLRRQRTRYRDDLLEGERIAQPVWLGALFGITALALVGLPPTSGFAGKALALLAARDTGGQAWFWVIVLGGTSLLVLAMVRVTSSLFWKTGTEPPRGDRAPVLQLLAATLPVVLGLALFVWGGPATRLAAAAAHQLHDRAALEHAVVPDPGRVDAQRERFQ